MILGFVVADLLLGDVHSLKEKRSVVRPIVAELKRFDVAAGETGDANLHRRAEISAAVVASNFSQVNEVLDSCERVLDEHPEVSVLSIRRRTMTDTDF